VTPKPRVHGPQTAKVVGENRSDREEIDVDEYGCILVQFHWDRDDKTTSRRVRVAQVWSGKGWGGQIIPRVGQEVVVEFLEGDPDEPLVIGTVYNDQHELPYELPANKNQSGLKSNSTPNGHGYNEFKFDDTDGSEVINLHAEKDLQSVIKHAETREIGEEFRGSTARRTTVKSGDDVLNVDNGSLLVEASKSIVLKVGQSTITIEQNSVTIDSPTVTVKSMNTEINGDATVVVKGQMITLN
jgi:type VI secretion system secreted protein VgrG